MYKLAHQLGDASGRGGERHLADLVGGGSEGFGKDGRLGNGGWEKGRERESRCRDIRGWLGGERKGGGDERREGGKGEGVQRREAVKEDDKSMRWQHAYIQEPPSDTKREEANPPTLPNSTTALKDTTTTTPPPQIFHNLTIYLSGSTAPLISDHKLKTLFVAHGGSVCLGLARRTVTHVILGEKTGLAAGKIQKEVQKKRGEAVKYVTAQWVVDSVKSGRRKGEGAYLPNNLGIGGRGQRGVGEMFGKEVKDR
jgi:hypothetical protein